MSIRYSTTTIRDILQIVGVATQVAPRANIITTMIKHASQGKTAEQIQIGVEKNLARVKTRTVVGGGMMLIATTAEVLILITVG